MEATDSGYGPMTDACEHANETLGTIESAEFLEQLRDSQLLKEDSNLWIIIIIIIIILTTTTTNPYGDGGQNCLGLFTT
jgi:hypothetical protein